MEIDKILKKKRVQILQIAEKHGASNLRIFGSVAKGKARQSSDLDILIELEPGKSLLDHAALLQELEKLLGCKVDVVTERGLKERIREQVLQEAVPL